MEDKARVINPWVAEILERGGDTDAAVRHAQSLARQAFASSDSLKGLIDRDFGGSYFRTGCLEALLHKERELDALRLRIALGGKGRAGDQPNLTALLQRRMHQYTRLAVEIAQQAGCCPKRRRLLEVYMEARRRQLYLGDADRVRAAIGAYLIACATNVTNSSVITALAS